MFQTSISECWQAIQESTVVSMRERDLLKRNLNSIVEKAHKDQAQLLLDVLEVLDSFERVFANVEPRLEHADRQTKIWIGNFRAVRRQIESLLKNHDVLPIESLDRPAIPGLHAIVDTSEKVGLDDGIILEERQRGYLWQGKLLRQALVVAVKN